MAEIPEKFVRWIHEKLEEYNLSQVEASRRAGLNQNAISDIVNGKVREVSLKAAKGLSRVFNTPLEEVLMLAGHIASADDDVSLRELLDIARNLSEEDRAELLDYARWRASRRSDGVKTED